MADLSSFLRPRSVAVVGASPRPGSVGGEILRNLLRCGYRGEVYPVNPKHAEVEGRPCFPDVRVLPHPADLAILAVDKSRVLKVVRSCGEVGTRNLVIVTAGFKEAGKEGEEREEELRRLVHDYRLNLVGPNCMGIVSSAPSAPLNASFSRWFPKPGEIAFISQSGSLGETVLESFGEMGLGLSLFVNLGNRAGLSENDFLAHLEKDGDSRIVFLYLESFADPVGFRRCVERISRTKPVVVLKSGRTQAGAAAVASHTGSLASADAVVDAFLDQCGAVRVTSIVELLRALRALERGALPRGRRVAILTNAGGAGIIAADACERSGIEVPRLPDPVRAKLASFLPAEAGLRNPVDMIATAGADHYEAGLRVALSSVDAGIVIFRPPLVLAEAPEAVADAILRAAKDVPEKPVLVSTTSRGPSVGPFVARLEAERVPTYVMPEEAVDALAILVRIGELRDRPRLPQHRPSSEKGRLGGILAGAREEGRASLRFEEGAKVLAGYGIAVCPFAYPTAAEDAALAAAELGFPAVAKVDAPGLFHRFERGAIVTGIRTPEEACDAFRRLSALIDEEEWSGGRVLLQPCLTGRELILGMKRDRSFGPVLMFGIGGTLVEALRDVVFGVAPLSLDQAERMIRSIRGFPLLGAFRGLPPVDLSALARALVRLGDLALDLHLIEEVDLNPFIAGEASAAVDLLIKLRGQ